ncbi:hypothetical protein [Streptomyces adelaidensis]|uniref:hypothetical protein n=1 Tax=Streptomyces adelaidensis TaxID=2796465 RepID=UPI001904554E|nr:hypothetical protein [Streptomyces adelaidensis]
MSDVPEFSRERAERLLGPAAVARARQIADAAPPLRPEVREQLRAVFASARTARPLPAADAA